MITDILRLAGALCLSLFLPPLLGWWLARRFGRDSLTTFTAACLTGVTTLALVQMLAYMLRLPAWVAGFALLAIALFSARPLLESIRAREFAWDALLAWAGVAAVLTAASLPLAVQGVEGSRWDWYEHWLRTLVFLLRAPITTDIGIYANPARGPLFNAAAAQLMWLAGSPHYWVFQAVAVTLNALICLPAALLLRSLAWLSRRQALLAASALCALWPYFFWNTTFTWTKSLTAAFILFGTERYLAAWGKRNTPAMAASLAWLAGGFLTHYLALIHAGVLGLHLLLVTRRSLPVATLFRVALLWAALIAPWFLYLFHHFGVRSTLAANATVGTYYASKDHQGHPIPYARVLLGNFCADWLPRNVCRPLWATAVLETCRTIDAPAPPSPLTFSPAPCRQGISLAGTGIFSVLGYSGMLALFLGIFGLARTRSRISGLPLMLWILGAGMIFNVLPFHWFEISGNFHNNLQAWCLLLAVLIIRGLMAMPRPVIGAVVLLLFAEYLPHNLRLIQQQGVVLPFPHFAASLRGTPPTGTMLPVPTATAPFHSGGDYYLNYLIKIQGGAVYFRDLHPDTYQTAAFAFLALGLLALAAAILRPDQAHFG